MSSSYIKPAVGRRILHQPFFPVQSPPPPPPAGDSSFFPSLPTPPPPPPTPSALATFPANISSLPVPRSSPTSHTNSVSPALIAVTVALSISAVAIAVFSIFLFLRGRRRRPADNDDDDKVAVSSRSDAAPPPPLPPVPPGLPPRIPRNRGNNSSEFLYLGTMANSRAVNGGGGARRGAFDPRKTDSPDLQPLPPLANPSPRRDVDVNPCSVQEDEEETFYSPRGSTSGRESSLGAGSGSRRAFATIPNMETISSPDSSSSGSSSARRSASLSISPPASGSTKSSKAKSPEIQAPHLAPPSPQLPPISFHSRTPPPAGFSSPESDLDIEARVKKEEEAEESPLLSNASSSSELSSPAESPTLSPLWTKAVKSSVSPPRAVDWSVFDGNQLSPISDRSTPSGKSPSIKLPRFFGGNRSKKTSPESTKMSNSPMSSPESMVSQSSSSKISYTPSQTARSYPASPIPTNGSTRLQHSTPASPLVSSRWSQQSSPEVRHFTNFTAPPPAPPPPPPPPPPARAMRMSESPPFVTPETSGRGLKFTEENQIGVSGSEFEASIGESADSKPKLKPLHWDKVRATSDREMVWDQLRSSSFKLNEEMIETLFVVNKPNNPNPKETSSKSVEPSPRQDQRVLDPKKAQNIAISLRALNVTVEEVCESLLEGNAEALGTEVLESILKMAPTKEEERKLREYKDDSPYKLGHAERFLKTLIDIPFAFKRVEAMLYVANFESEVEYLKKSFETLENACDELRNSRMFLKLLEAVLKTGNRMNVGTNRGDAHAFKLDTLLKLVDVKGTDGKTTLLHFVVQEMTRTEGARLSSDESKCRKLGLQVVSSLTSELTNVKKAAAMDSEALSNEVGSLFKGLAAIEGVSSFSESMEKFVRGAEEEIFRVQAQESVALSLVKEITEYFHGDSAKEEAHPFRVFVVVRDFLAVLDRVCKEVGSINDRTVVTSGHRFPVPVNPLLNGFQFMRNSSSSDGESSL